ncbi:hypothetical protein M426DRAFT_28676 [Hypoxylon sp. CI-4A]|nr:hypothetical protein M426DRAFT_28676 [Hypoxylon sp. CI-4A]
MPSRKTAPPKPAMKRTAQPQSPKYKPRARDHLMASVRSPGEFDANDFKSEIKDTNARSFQGTSSLTIPTSALSHTGFAGSNQLRDFYGTPSKKPREKKSTPKKPTSTPKKPTPTPKKSTPAKRLTAPKKKSTAMKRLGPKPSDSDDEGGEYASVKRGAKPPKFTDVEKLYNTSKDSRYAHLFNQRD